jgi:hypothetical protein
MVRMMYELKLRKYKNEFYLADNSGHIIIKRLSQLQILDIQKYEKGRIESLRRD